MTGHAMWPSTQPVLEVFAYNPDLAAAVAAVKARAATRAYGPLWGTEALHAWLTGRCEVTTVDQRLGATGTTAVVAAVDGALAGAGLIRPEGHGRWYLSDVYVDPPGHGVGSAIVRTLLGQTTGPVRCFVIDGNEDAQSFWERHGFVRTGTAPNQEAPGTIGEYLLVR